ncbi:MAG: hypothetical protein HKM02_06335 [Pseudomonadales bacterium]|nr:hypothetical protein [Pseudomonadales bacterium]
MGFWAGIASVRNRPLGMIWIDAHMDSHTPDTSLSHRLHGMPLAVLLGQGDTRWQTICPTPVLDLRGCTLIGFRSFEAEEIKLLEHLGITLISIHELRSQGWPAIWHQALLRARSCAGGYGISLDLDALSPHLAPGVSVPEPCGIDIRHLQRQLKSCRYDTKLLALEIAEFNPRQDVRGRTAKLVRQLLQDQGITRHPAYPKGVV